MLYAVVIRNKILLLSRERVTDGSYFHAYVNICAMASISTTAFLLVNLELLLTIRSCRDERKSPVSLDAVLDRRYKF